MKRLNAFRHADVVKTTTTKARVGMEEKRDWSDFERAEHGSWCQTGWSEWLTNCCWSTGIFTTSQSPLALLRMSPRKTENIQWAAAVRRKMLCWCPGSEVSRHGQQTWTQITPGYNQGLQSSISQCTYTLWFDLSFQKVADEFIYFK